MIIPGKLIKFEEYKESGQEIEDAFTVPGAGGRFGDYCARLIEVPHPRHPVTITGTPAGGGNGFVEVPYMPTASGEFLVVYNRGDVYFYATDAGSNVVASYKPRGSLIQANHLNAMQSVLCIPFIITGRLDTKTPTNSWALKIPLNTDEPTLYIQGVTINANIFSGQLVTGNTTIRVSNKTYLASGANNLDVTLTRQGGETDRCNTAKGLVAIQTATEALYIHIHEGGGHDTVTGWVWFRRA